MECPEAETLAQLAGGGGDLETRASIADHAATCESCHAALAALVDEPQRVGRYVLGRKLGAGGMGVVYEASDPELGRNVAIKMLRRGAQAQRLRREAQALARLAHANVVTVYDVGEHDGQVFVAMALVDGDNLRQWAKRGPHSTREILGVLVRAARGVAAAHQAGLVHRDLKPDNIFVSRSGEVLVGDFGLARDSSDDDAETDEDIAAASTNLTMTGMVLGTPAYMPPEQAEGTATEASDQFSFCITAFEALHGIRPFAGDTFEELQQNIRAARQAEPAHPRPLPARIARALRRGLAADPADRFPSMNALIAAIEPRPSWVRRALPLAAAAVVAGAIATAVLVTRGARGPDCTATGQELASTWSAPQRAAVARALRDHRVAPQAADELTGELDRYATRWLAVREETCGAEPRLSHDQMSARRACLDARAAELAGMIKDVETAADPDPLALWQRIDVLSPPEACRDDATAKLAVGAAGHTELMTTIAALDRGAIEPGELERVRARAEAAHDLPALLALDLAHGRFLIDDHSAAQADAPLQQALALAEQLGVASARIRALALLARSACKQGRFDASSPLLVMADADAAHDAADSVDADVVMRARAECLYQRRAPEAVPILRELLAHATARYGADSPAEVDLHLQLGEIYYSLGQLDDGAREVAACDRIWSRFVIPGAQAAQHEEDAASAAFRGGDLALATEHQRRAVELRASDSIDERAGGIATLALMYEVGAEPQLAVATHAQVVGLVPRGSGSSGSLRVESMVQTGVLKLQLGDVAAAAAAYDQAADEARELGLADLANDAEIGRGRVAVERGDFARGARILKDALPMFTTRPDGSPFRSGVAQFALARALAETGDATGAASLASQAETNVAQGVADAKANPLGSKLVASRQAVLDQITRWRDSRARRR